GQLMRWQDLENAPTVDQFMLLGTYNLLNSHSLSVAAITLSPDGTQFALAISDGSVQTRDTSSLNLVDIYSGHSAPVNDIRWSPDGRAIATASTDTTVQIWQEP